MTGDINMSFDIEFLPKEQWKGTILLMDYVTPTYYDVEVQRQERGFSVNIQLREFFEPLVIRSETYDFPDSLYQDHWVAAEAYGILHEGKLIAAMELCPESWSNRLRMTELWVHPDFQKQGLGGKLMDFAKDYVRKKKYRTLMLETQSCNVNAVDFYLHKGLTLIGFDACCYNNKDLERKEVRLEMGWFPEETA